LNAAEARPRTAVLIKALGTAIVCGLIWWSFQNPDKGMLREVTAFGPAVAVAVAAAFFAAVIAYASDLRRLLQAIPENHRAAQPNSVWWMLLIPYNFTEDFFIIENIARSLENIAKARPGLVRPLGHFGRRSGLGWCALQILSLVPHDVGSLGGVLALPLWLWHWRFVRKARAAMTQKA
jgi:hypothetical protein